MVCGGFTCSKNALCSLNVVYMLVGLLLIVVAAWGKGFGIVSSIHIIGFLTRCILGVWLAMRYRNQKDPRANPSAFL
ncbi:tetraspanin-31-like [Sinocyclocheilus rhinocerous]|uniref:tetraspanin-31-like n=1 Tax=Sinocyclocheilus rhinocerous TaxID=307959 RepID=UPI0007B945FF|nr:PREDICTED: tetraspanin-31-like [Sinocyclocheilus rhinocerous]